MPTDEIDRQVWEAARKGGRKGSELTVGVVFARTGLQLTHKQLQQSLERMLADGRLYWRNNRIRRQVKAGHWPELAPEPAPEPDQPGLWESPTGGGYAP